MPARADCGARLHFRVEAISLTNLIRVSWSLAVFRASRSASRIDRRMPSAADKTPPLRTKPGPVRRGGESRQPPFGREHRQQRLHVPTRASGQVVQVEVSAQLKWITAGSSFGQATSTAARTGPKTSIWNAFKPQIKRTADGVANVAVPPAGFEPATHGLGNRCSIP